LWRASCSQIVWLGVLALWIVSCLGQSACIFIEIRPLTSAILAVNKELSPPMEDTVDDQFSTMRTRSKRGSLSVSTRHPHDTGIIIEVVEPSEIPAGDALDSPLSPPSGSSTPSHQAAFSSSISPLPPTPGSSASRTRSSTLGPIQQVSRVGPQRTRSSTLSSPRSSTSGMSSVTSAAAGAIQKRKRSRVTPDQLSYLERMFSVDRSPTAAKRKEISETLGMNERQTQIWFQNR